MWKAAFTGRSVHSDNSPYASHGNAVRRERSQTERRGDDDYDDDERYTYSAHGSTDGRKRRDTNGKRRRSDRGSTRGSIIYENDHDNRREPRATANGSDAISKRAQREADEGWEDDEDVSTRDTRRKTSSAARADSGVKEERRRSMTSDTGDVKSKARKGRGYEDRNSRPEPPVGTYGQSQSQFSETTSGTAGTRGDQNRYSMSGAIGYEPGRIQSQPYGEGRSRSSPLLPNPHGAAAEFYGDQGQSVGFQPGVRTHTPNMLVNPDKHLITPSATINPAQDTGHGSAAEFYTGDFAIPSSGTANAPNKPPRTGSASTGKLPKPSRKSSSSSNKMEPGRVTSAPVSAAGGVAKGYLDNSSAQHQAGESASYYHGSSPNGLQKASEPSAAPLRPIRHNSEPAVSPLGGVYIPPPGTNAGLSNYGPDAQPGKSSVPSQNHSHAGLYAVGAAAAGLTAYESMQNREKYHAGLDNGHAKASTSYATGGSRGPPPIGPRNAGSFYGGSDTRGFAMEPQRFHEHKGPMTRLKDGLLNLVSSPEDVRKMEEYTEFIGICKYCFDPRTSIADAPRVHHFHSHGRKDSFESLRRRTSWERLRRRGSGDSLRKTGNVRVDKETRYYVDRKARRSGDNTALVGAGLAGAGLAAAGASILRDDRKDFDDTYSVLSGHRESSPLRRRSRSSSREKRRRSAYGVARPASRDGGRTKREHVLVTTPDGRRERRLVVYRSRSRSNSRSRVSSTVAGGIIGAGLGTAMSRRSRTPSPSHPHTTVSRRRGDASGHRPPSVPVQYGRGTVQSHMDRTNTQPSEPSTGIFGGFFDAPPKKRKNRTSASKKKNSGFFSFGNGSSSSDDGLAFGTESMLSRKSSRSSLGRRTSTGRPARKRRTSDERMNMAMLGIGATAAALAAAQKGRVSKRSSQADLRTKRDRRQDYIRRQPHPSDEDSEWEDELPSDVDDASSVSSGLAFGEVYGRQLSRKQSKESLSSSSSAGGLGAWGWRWGTDRKRKRRQDADTTTLPQQSDYRPPSGSHGPAAPEVAASLATESVSQIYRPGHAESAVTSADATPQAPMQYVDPRPISEEGSVVMGRRSRTPGESEPPDQFFSRPGPGPIQQPQPIAPLKAQFTDETAESRPSRSPAPHEAERRKPRRSASSPTRPTSADGGFGIADAALLAGAALATGSIIAGASRRNKDPSNVRFGFTDEQQRKHDRDAERDTREFEEERRRVAREHALKDEAENAARESDAQRRNPAFPGPAEEERLEAARREAAEQEEMDRETQRRARDDRRRAEREQAEEEAERETRRRDLERARVDDEARRQEESRLQWEQEMESRRRKEMEEREAVENEARERLHREKFERLIDDAPLNQARSTPTSQAISAAQDASRKPSEWEAPIGVAAVGAGIGAAMAAADHGEALANTKEPGSAPIVYAHVEPTNEHQGEPVMDDELFDKDLFKRKRSDSGSKSARAAQELKEWQAERDAADKVVNDMEDRYREPQQTAAEFFMPKELLDRQAEGKERSSSPNFDAVVYNYDARHMPPRYDPFQDRRGSKASRDWRTNVPRLNVIAPTPPLSSRSSTPLIPSEPEPQPVYQAIPESERETAAPGVSRGEDSTHTYEVSIPESYRDGKEHDVQPRLPNSESTTLDEAQAGPGAHEDIAEHNDDDSVEDITSEDGPYDQPFYTSVPDLSNFLGMDSPGTEGAPPVQGFIEGEVDDPTPAEEKEPHIPGQFESDVYQPQGLAHQQPLDNENAMAETSEAHGRDALAATVAAATGEYGNRYEPEEMKGTHTGAPMATDVTWHSLPSDIPGPRDEAERYFDVTESAKLPYDATLEGPSDTAKDLWDAEAAAEEQREPGWESTLNQKEMQDREKEASRMSFRSGDPASGGITADVVEPSLPPARLYNIEEPSREPFLSNSEKKRHEKPAKSSGFADIAAAAMTTGGIAALAAAAKNAGSSSSEDQPSSKKLNKNKDPFPDIERDIRDIEPRYESSRLDEPIHMPGGWASSSDRDPERPVESDTADSRETSRRASITEHGPLPESFAEIKSFDEYYPRRRPDDTADRPEVHATEDPAALAATSGAHTSPPGEARLHANGHDDKGGVTVAAAEKDLPIRQDIGSDSVSTNRQRRGSLHVRFPDEEDGMESVRLDEVPDRRTPRDRGSRRGSDYAEESFAYDDPRPTGAPDRADAYAGERTNRRRSKPGDDLDGSAYEHSSRSARDEQPEDSPRDNRRVGVLGSFDRRSAENAPPSRSRIEDERDDEERRHRHRRRRDSEASFDDDGRSVDSKGRPRRRRSQPEYATEDGRSTTTSEDRRRRRRSERDVDASRSDPRYRHHEDEREDRYGDDDTYSRRSGESENHNRHRRHRSGDSDAHTGRRSFLDDRVGDDMPPLPAIPPVSPFEASDEQEQGIGNSAMAEEGGLQTVSRDFAAVDDQQESNTELLQGATTAPSADKIDHEIENALAENLPELPRDSPPSSPTAILETPDRPTALLRSASNTAVPLRFRQPPSSPVASRDGQAGPRASLSSPVSPAVVRGRQTRAKSGEFRPLWLVESNTKTPQVEETLPSLPSSKPSSRASSLHGGDEWPFTEGTVYDAPQEREPSLRVDTERANDLASDDDILDSQQTTPKAGVFPHPVERPPKQEPQFYTWEDLMRDEQMRGTPEQQQSVIDADPDEQELDPDGSQSEGAISHRGVAAAALVTGAVAGIAAGTAGLLIHQRRLSLDSTEASTDMDPRASLAPEMDENPTSSSSPTSDDQAGPTVATPSSRKASKKAAKKQKKAQRQLSLAEADNLVEDSKEIDPAAGAAAVFDEPQALAPTSPSMQGRDVQDRVSHTALWESRDSDIPQLEASSRPDSIEHMPGDSISDESAQPLVESFEPEEPFSEETTQPLVEYNEPQSFVSEETTQHLSGDLEIGDSISEEGPADHLQPQDFPSEETAPPLVGYLERQHLDSRDVTQAPVELLEPERSVLEGTAQPVAEYLNPEESDSKDVTQSLDGYPESRDFDSKEVTDLLEEHFEPADSDFKESTQPLGEHPDSGNAGFREEEQSEEEGLELVKPGSEEAMLPLVEYLEPSGGTIHTLTSDDIETTVPEGHDGRPLASPVDLLMQQSHDASDHSTPMEVHAAGFVDQPPESETFEQPDSGLAETELVEYLEPSGGTIQTLTSDDIETTIPRGHDGRPLASPVNLPTQQSHDASEHLTPMEVHAAGPVDHLLVSDNFEQPDTRPAETELAQIDEPEFQRSDTPELLDKMDVDPEALQLQPAKVATSEEQYMSPGSPTTDPGTEFEWQPLSQSPADHGPQRAERSHESQLETPVYDLENDQEQYETNRFHEDLRQTRDEPHLDTPRGADFPEVSYELQPGLHDQTGLNYRDESGRESQLETAVSDMEGDHDQHEAGSLHEIVHQTPDEPLLDTSSDARFQEVPRESLPHLQGEHGPDSIQATASEHSSAEIEQHSPRFEIERESADERILNVPSDNAEAEVKAAQDGEAPDMPEAIAVASTTLEKAKSDDEVAPLFSRKQSKKGKKKRKAAARQGPSNTVDLQPDDDADQTVEERYQPLERDEEADSLAPESKDFAAPDPIEISPAEPELTSTSRDMGELEVEARPSLSRKQSKKAKKKQKAAAKKSSEAHIEKEAAVDESDNADKDDIVAEPAARAPLELHEDSFDLPRETRSEDMETSEKVPSDYPIAPPRDTSSAVDEQAVETDVSRHSPDDTEFKRHQPSPLAGPIVSELSDAELPSESQEKPFGEETFEATEQVSFTSGFPVMPYESPKSPATPAMNEPAISHRPEQADYSNVQELAEADKRYHDGAEAEGGEAAEQQAFGGVPVISEGERFPGRQELDDIVEPRESHLGSEPHRTSSRGLDGRQGSYPHEEEISEPGADLAPVATFDFATNLANIHHHKVDEESLPSHHENLQHEERELVASPVSETIENPSASFGDAGMSAGNDHDSAVQEARETEAFPPFDPVNEMSYVDDSAALSPGQFDPERDFRLPSPPYEELPPPAEASPHHIDSRFGENLAVQSLVSAHDEQVSPRESFETRHENIVPSSPLDDGSSQSADGDRPRHYAVEYPHSPVTDDAQLELAVAGRDEFHKRTEPSPTSYENMLDAAQLHQQTSVEVPSSPVRRSSSETAAIDDHAMTNFPLEHTDVPRDDNVRTRTPEPEPTSSEQHDRIDAETMEATNTISDPVPTETAYRSYEDFAQPADEQPANDNDDNWPSNALLKRGKKGKKGKKARKASKQVQDPEISERFPAESSTPADPETGDTEFEMPDRPESSTARLPAWKEGEHISDIHDLDTRGKLDRHIEPIVEDTTESLVHHADGLDQRAIDRSGYDTEYTSTNFPKGGQEGRLETAEDDTATELREQQPIGHPILAESAEQEKEDLESSRASASSAKKKKKKKGKKNQAVPLPSMRSNTDEDESSSSITKEALAGAIAAAAATSRLLMFDDQTGGDRDETHHRNVPSERAYDAVEGNQTVPSRSQQSFPTGESEEESSERPDQTTSHLDKPRSDEQIEAPFPQHSGLTVADSLAHAELLSPGADHEQQFPEEKQDLTRSADSGREGIFENEDDHDAQTREPEAAQSLLHDVGRPESAEVYDRPTPTPGEWRRDDAAEPEGILYTSGTQMSRSREDIEEDMPAYTSEHPMEDPPESTFIHPSSGTTNDEDERHERSSRAESPPQMLREVTPGSHSARSDTGSEIAATRDAQLIHEEPQTVEHELISRFESAPPKDFELQDERVREEERELSLHDCPLDQPPPFDQSPLTLQRRVSNEQLPTDPHAEHALMEDVDFAATVAAGLAHSGFDPAMVMNDPSFARRLSPHLDSPEADPDEISSMSKPRDWAGMKEQQSDYSSVEDALDQGPRATPDRNQSPNDDLEEAVSRSLRDAGFDPALVDGVLSSNKEPTSGEAAGDDTTHSFTRRRRRNKRSKSNSSQSATSEEGESSVEATEPLAPAVETVQPLTVAPVHDLSAAHPSLYSSFDLHEREHVEPSPGDTGTIERGPPGAFPQEDEVMHPGDSQDTSTTVQPLEPPSELTPDPDALNTEFAPAAVDRAEPASESTQGLATVEQEHALGADDHRPTSQFTPSLTAADDEDAAGAFERSEPASESARGPADVDDRGAPAAIDLPPTRGFSTALSVLDVDDMNDAPVPVDLPEPTSEYTYGPDTTNSEEAAASVHQQEPTSESAPGFAAIDNEGATVDQRESVQELNLSPAAVDVKNVPAVIDNPEPSSGFSPGLAAISESDSRALSGHGDTLTLSAGGHPRETPAASTDATDVDWPVPVTSKKKKKGKSGRRAGNAGDSSTIIPTSDTTDDTVPVEMPSLINQNLEIEPQPAELSVDEMDDAFRAYKKNKRKQKKERAKAAKSQASKQVEDAVSDQRKREVGRSSSHEEDNPNRSNHDVSMDEPEKHERQHEAEEEFMMPRSDDRQHPDFLSETDAERGPRFEKPHTLDPHRELGSHPRDDGPELSYQFQDDHQHQVLNYPGAEQPPGFEAPLVGLNDLPDPTQQLELDYGTTRPYGSEQQPNLEPGVREDEEHDNAESPEVEPRGELFDHITTEQGPLVAEPSHEARYHQDDDLFAEEEQHSDVERSSAAEQRSEASLDFPPGRQGESTHDAESQAPDYFSHRKPDLWTSETTEPQYMPEAESEDNDGVELGIARSMNVDDSPHLVKGEVMHTSEVSQMLPTAVPRSPSPKSWRDAEPEWSFENAESQNAAAEGGGDQQHHDTRATVRDSGYQSIKSPVEAARHSILFSESKPGASPLHENVQMRRSQETLRQSPGVDDDWNLNMPKHRTAPITPPHQHVQDRSASQKSNKTPLESESKDRSSYLFNTPPAAFTDNAEAMTPTIPPVTRGRDVRGEYDVDSPPREATRRDAGSGDATSTPFERSVSPTSPTGPMSPLMGLQAIPEEHHAPKRAHALSDIGSPERGVKRTETPSAFPERAFSPPTREARQLTPLHTRSLSSHSNKESTPDRSSGAVSAARSRLFSPDRSAHRNPSLGALSNPRSPSVLSARSYSSVGQQHFRAPEDMRSFSRSSQRSATPTLRRTSMSGDLRAVSRASLRGDSGSAVSSSQQTNPPFEPPPTPPLEHDDLIHGSASRAADMADVFHGVGDAQSSRASPTRPPSIRKRQSMQIVDLESRLEQLAAENRALQAQQFGGSTRGGGFHEDSELLETLEAREDELRRRDVEIGQIRAMLVPLQQEVDRLNEINAGLTDANKNLVEDVNGRYATLQAEHAQTHQEWEKAQVELTSMRNEHQRISSSVRSVVEAEITAALADKDTEIRRLREELEIATERIRALQVQLQSSKSGEFLDVRDEDFFDGACQKLCQHVQQWVLRFSKTSDNRVCRLSMDLKDDKLEGRLDNAILDGSDVDRLLGDRVRRRDVFMSVVMTMVWEYIFTRYLFGMDREQRQKLKALEKLLAEVGPTRAVAQWRATTLSLLSKRPQFEKQRALDTEAVTHEIFTTLCALLPPPASQEQSLLGSLERVIGVAVELSIQMRTQRAEFIMLPPLQPDYDTDGELVRKVHFNATLMNERSGNFSSNEELEQERAVVKMVLFPLVVKKGDDFGEGDEEIVVAPAQVLVQNEHNKKKVVRVVSGAMDIDDRRRSSQQSLVGARVGPVS